MAYLGNVFPRNADGTLKRRKPCQTPGCKSPNWHICLDVSDPAHKKVHAIRPKRAAMPASQRAAIAEAQRERHAIQRAFTKERDDQIIKRYVEDNLGMSNIAHQMQIAQSTVNKVLQRAQREGVLRIRPKGRTLFRPGVS